MNHHAPAEAASGSRRIAGLMIAGGFVALAVAMLGMLALGVALLRG